MSRVNHNGSLKCQIPLTDANTANYTSHNWADGPMAGLASSEQLNAVLADISLADDWTRAACWVTL